MAAWMVWLHANHFAPIMLIQILREVGVEQKKVC